MDDFVFEVVVDICARTFKLKSSNGDNKIIVCDDTDEFMRVLEVCDKISILRDGNLIRSGDIKFEDKSSIVEAMLGTKQEVAFPVCTPPVFKAAF